MTPRVVAHRGYSARFPENTLPAFDAARIPGVVAVEFDVQLSRDAVPVVIHDQTLARVGNDPRHVAKMDMAELCGLDVGSWRDPAFASAWIPRLEEVLEVLHDRELWIEIKVHPGDAESGRGIRTVVETERVLARAGASDRSRILCFHRPILETTRLPRVWNLERPVPVNTPHDLLAVDIDVDALTPGFAATVREAGLNLTCYTVNASGQLRRAVDCGVDAVICDDPAWALSKL